MNFLVIGEPCVDVIHTVNNEKIQSYGGILYSIITLAVLAENDDSVLPIMNLGSDEYDNITSILKLYPNILLDGIYKVEHPTRKVNLYYHIYRSGKSARMESSTAPTYTLEYEKISPFLKRADAMLINMISGVDINLDTLKQIRNNFSGPMHIDIHNLVMKTNPDGTREHTHLENWVDWCTNTDTLQMNEFEIAVISAEKKNEYNIADKILIHSQKNVRGIAVTKGIEGVTGYTKAEKKYGDTLYVDLERMDLPAIENPHFKDTTGCGDVFAASFLFDYSKNLTFGKALHYANRKASFNTSLEGINELCNLK
jgi:hypothetical protein